VSHCGHGNGSYQLQTLQVVHTIQHSLARANQRRDEVDLHFVYKAGDEALTGRACSPGQATHPARPRRADHTLYRLRAILLEHGIERLTDGSEGKNVLRDWAKSRASPWSHATREISSGTAVAGDEGALH